MLRENICSTYFFISGLTRQPLRDSRYVIALKIKMIKILPVTVKERETKRKVWLVFALNQMWANWATLGNQQIFWFNKSYVLKQLENRSPRCIPFHFISCKKNIFFDKNKEKPLKFVFWLTYAHYEYFILWSPYSPENKINILFNISIAHWKCAPVYPRWTKDFQFWCTIDNQ